MRDYQIKQFSFNLLCAIPTYETLITNPSEDQLTKVYDQVYENFILTQFLSLTKFTQLGICLAMVDDQTSTDEINYFESKKNLIVRRNFQQQVMQPALRDRYEDFMLCNLNDILKIISIKYGLRIEHLVGITPKSFEFKQNTHQERDELRINVRLVVGKFGDQEDALAFHKLVEQINGRLDFANCGFVESVDVGMGFRTIYCCGKSANTMFATVSALLEGLPPNSYVELLSQGIKVDTRIL